MTTSRHVGRVAGGGRSVAVTSQAAGGVTAGPDNVGRRGSGEREVGGRAGAGEYGHVTVTISRETADIIQKEGTQDLIERYSSQAHIRQPLRQNPHFPAIRSTRQTQHGPNTWEGEEQRPRAL